MALALPPSALCTLAELREFAGISGAGRDELGKAAILAATGGIESYLSRRLRYRAPAEVDGGANLAAAVALVETATTAVTIAAQPAAGRTLKLKITCPASTITAGTVTVTGTVGGTAGTTETFSVAHGYEQDGTKFFSALSAISYTGMVGVATGDTVQLGSSVGYVEEHELDADRQLRPLEWPVLNVLDANEDSSRAFAAATSLVATDYGLRKGGAEERAELYRLSSASRSSWSSGWRTVRLVYSAGFGPASVPWLLKDACRHLAALIYQDSAPGIGGQRLGVISASDSQGNWSRFAPSALNDQQRQQLDGLRRWAFSETGVRDFDLSEVA